MNLSEKKKTRELIGRYRVRVSMDAAPAGMELLTPDSSLKWGLCDFDFNPQEESKEYDFWIVFGNPGKCEQAKVAPENTLFVAGEPPSKKIYPGKYYRQFGHIVDTHRGSKHPLLKIDAPAICWLVGLNIKKLCFEYGYNELIKMKRPPKENKIGVVCSSSSKTAGQRTRLRFLEKLKDQLGDQIIHFGKGFTPIDDKMQGIAPYRFQLVLENSLSPHYWTEKLTDAYLGWAYPFYVGCPNLAEYFDDNGFVSLDINNPSKSAEQIQAALQENETQSEILAVEKARDQILTKYNPFSRFDRWVCEFYKDLPKDMVTIRHSKYFRLRNRLLRLH